MEAINELEIRKWLKKKELTDSLLRQIVRHLLNPKVSWEDQRTLWFFLWNWGHRETLAHTLVECLTSKVRIPFDLFIQLTGHVKPSSGALEACLKGLRKNRAQEEVLCARSWEQWDSRFLDLRKEVRGQKLKQARKLKESLLEKFHFLKNQRLVEQAGQVLKRMLDIFPDDKELQSLRENFDEEWARNVVANHLSYRAEEEALAPPPNSQVDQTMVECFLIEGEKIAAQFLDLPRDLAVAFLFMLEPLSGLKALNWSVPSQSDEWLKAELMLLAGRHVELLEHLAQIEIKMAHDPETIFGVSYLRAQSYKALGQQGMALEILRSIVKVRPNYRSAQALILEWTQGVTWE